ncbi:MAG: hypothetical protein QF805_27835, partial [Pirellulaceae bacterium]|nr:hypothetical protein [Pirellulaceae bacterium]
MKWDWRSAAVAWWAVAVALTGAVAGDERIDIAVGMSGSQPIAARVTAADWDHFTKRTRVLLVGDGPRSAKSIEDAWEWFHRDEQAQLRKSFALSAVPNAAPIKKGREAALRGFPPPGPAYKSPWSVENQYLWRWIGMHAPDLVVVVDAGDSEGALVASTGGKALRSIRRPAPVTQTPATQDAKSRRLGAALAKYAACETGVIDAVHLNSGGGAESIQVLLGELQRVGFQGPSAARLELQKRLARAPVEVAQQLSQHYGRDLKQVV